MKYLSITRAGVEVRARLSRQGDAEAGRCGGWEIRSFPSQSRRMRRPNSRTTPASLLRHFCGNVTLLVGEGGPACPQNSQAAEAQAQDPVKEKTPLLLPISSRPSLSATPAPKPGVPALGTRSARYAAPVPRA